MTPQDDISPEVLARHQKVLDAIPLPIFLVDDDLRILASNKAARPFLGKDPAKAYRRRGGDLFHCLHSTDAPEGCGHGDACRECVLRNSVAGTFQGKETVRARMRMELLREGSLAEVFLSVSASPLELDGRTLALLTLEDVEQIVTLEALLPICMGCKKVRSDKTYWQTIERYLETHFDIDFSHGLCPECRDRTLKEWRTAKARGGH
ncbi:MAG: PAS domain-containing protein [Verrucomicrobiae bacterium]|nr:PAS domain-containing protein [Verrucomicrobiae bacterium]